jgi:phosphate transport system permease protein
MSKVDNTWKIRSFLDLLARRVVQVGGISVIIAIALIFIFLLSVVYPLFEKPEVEFSSRYQAPGDAQQTLYLAVEEQAEIGLRLTQSGQVYFFDITDGKVLKQFSLPIQEDNPIRAFQVVNELQRKLAVVLMSGEILIFDHQYRLEFTESERIIHPSISFPYGEQLYALSPQSIKHFAVGENDESLSVIAITDNDKVIYKSFDKETSFISESATLEDDSVAILGQSSNILSVLLDPEQEWAYTLTGSGELSVYDVRDRYAPQLLEKIMVTEAPVTPTVMKYLTGGVSLLIGDSSGQLSQWFQVRSEGELAFRLQKIRSSKIDDSPVTSIAAELLRKGVIAGSEAGNIKLLYTTSERNLLTIPAGTDAVGRVAVAPRADVFISEGENNMLQIWEVDNQHPESSMSALWGKIWYEDYVKPDYIWQSSSASSDFESKFSLMPLTFGTLKAAFYAMLFAMPLAIFGAIFTAYFMAPSMRSVVKPTIEIMEALPTVILGFLAGLWLAPFVEMHLPGIFSVLILMPIGIVLLSLLWWRLPAKYKLYIPEGWQAAYLILPIILITLLCVKVSPMIEIWLFEGNVRIWMSETLGIGFDQRNALIIGIAMGFAVIPTIFSIAEDAIFSVPKHLTSGSLALGATPWQTLVRVVLLSASPGIFSAVMIGFGRAVGETMIVLMATGNTPVMDFSVFQGMRTLSANVAVELPESEVDSTHYRILFLAAFVLFIFTFFFNTVAEIVRQRLRKKYSSL